MFVDDSKVLEDFNCTLPLFNPVASNCHQFCRACIEQHINSDSDGLCSVGCKPLGSLTDVSGPLVKPMLQMLLAIEVYSFHRHGDQGCQARSCPLFVMIDLLSALRCAGDGAAPAT